MPAVCCYILSLSGLVYLSGSDSGSGGDVREVFLTIAVVALAICICCDAIKAIGGLFGRKP